MGKKSDKGMGSDYHSSKNLESKKNDLFPSNIGKDTPLEVEKFLEVYPTLMGQALILMLSQDEVNLKLTINQLQSISNEAKAVSEDEIEMSVMDYMVGMIAFFEPLLRSMRFMNQGRFEIASKEYAKLKATCISSVEDLTN